MIESIESRRLIYRPLEAADAEDLFELDSNPEVHRYLGNQPIHKLEESEQVIKLVQNQYKEIGIGRWAVVIKSSNECIGWAGLKYETKIKTENPYYDLGYRLKQSHWGKGYGTEAAFTSLNYGFIQLNLKEISAAAHINNLASNLILKKIGLKWKELFEFEGEKVNWYSLNRTEYLASK